MICPFISPCVFRLPPQNAINCNPKFNLTVFHYSCPDTGDNLLPENSGYCDFTEFLI